MNVEIFCKQLIKFLRSFENFHLNFWKLERIYCKNGKISLTFIAETLEKIRKFMIKYWNIENFLQKWKNIHALLLKFWFCYNIGSN